jgi:hypothetical protein
MMKKFLEVLVDENGTYHFSTEDEFVTEEEFAAGDIPAKTEHMNACQSRLTQLVHDLTEYMWKTKDQSVSQAVRLLATAEILGCAQPYERAEEFWSMMMFHTIPQFEDFAAAIKRPYGFNDRGVTRPIVGGPLVDGRDIMAFPIPQPFGKTMS